jgi:hypothetical protein
VVKYKTSFAVRDFLDKLFAIKFDHALLENQDWIGQIEGYKTTNVKSD